MRRFATALIAASVLGWSCQKGPPVIERASLPEGGQAIAHAIDVGPRGRPSEEALSGCARVRLDAVEFFDLIASAEPRAGRSLWKGGFLVSVHGGASGLDLYHISYYGNFFTRVGEPGYYVIPASNRARWEHFWNGTLSELREKLATCETRSS